eukprot:scaffold115842_cov52-Phaeocystis_antarctica.AAC.3
MASWGTPAGSSPTTATPWLGRSAAYETKVPTTVRTSVVARGQIAVGMRFCSCVEPSRMSAVATPSPSA